jgi:hypothetical protein
VFWQSSHREINAEPLHLFEGLPILSLALATGIKQLGQFYEPWSRIGLGGDHIVGWLIAGETIGRFAPSRPFRTLSRVAIEDLAEVGKYPIFKLHIVLVRGHVLDCQTYQLHMTRRLSIESEIRI